MLINLDFLVKKDFLNRYTCLNCITLFHFSEKGVHVATRAIGITE